MQQLIQHLKTGETRLETVPVPQVGAGQVLIQTRRSLVSTGTERMLVQFGRAGLLAKARQQPERVKQVLEKIRADGLRPTIEAVFRKLDQPLPMGYCNAGIVLAVGAGVTDLRIGDRVVSNGAHAEVVCVSRRLVAPIADTVSDEEATFAIPGAIGLHGIRLLNPTLNETVVVVGLGLIGLLTADLLRINGCRVIGIDVDEAKCDLARQRGITTLKTGDGTDAVKTVLSLTNGVGADGIIITAAAKNDTVLLETARMSRQRGRIVLIGVVDLTLNRDEFYRKELTFQVACSYGPGRYDETYEQQGHDYPLPYVRWTANRNFETILELLERGQLAVKSLITEVVPFADFARIYGRMNKSAPTDRPIIASLMSYPETVSLTQIVVLREPPYQSGNGGIGLIGAGNFVGATLLPALKAAGAIPKIIASTRGLSGTLLARKYAISQSTTDYRQVISDPNIDWCFIATRHDSHAKLTIDALQAGKHVFVEKPLAIHHHELPAIINAQLASGKMVLVGFNRRFSPYVQKMKTLLTSSAEIKEPVGNLPMNVVITVNAGFIPANSWVHDRTVGGGRIVGELCHFIDLISFLTGSCVSRVCTNAMGQHPTETSDSVSVLLHYKNGSTGVINYFANGSKAYAKERVEVYWQEKTLVLDNFRQLTAYGFRGFTGMSGRQDKGHHELVKRLVRQITTTDANSFPGTLIPFADSINTTQTTLLALDSLREQRWIDVPAILEIGQHPILPANS